MMIALTFVCNIKCHFVFNIRHTYSTCQEIMANCVMTAKEQPICMIQFLMM